MTVHHGNCWGYNMRKIIMILLLASSAYASKFAQVQWSTTTWQINKYISGSYNFGSSTTSAKSNYGVRISSNGFGYFNNLELLNDRMFYFNEVLDFYSRHDGKTVISLGSPIVIEANMDFLGNMTMLSGKTIDGRDVSADGAKLDTLESDLYDTQQATGTLMRYSQYDADKDGKVNYAVLSDTALYISGLVSTATYSYHSATATYAVNSGTAVFANNSDTLDGVHRTGYMNNPAIADGNLNGYRITNSSTIAYSTYSATLVNANYVFKNTPYLLKIVIGTTTLTTTSSAFVEMGLRSTLKVNTVGTIVSYSYFKITNSVKNTLVDFEFRISTSPSYTSETVIGESTYFAPTADAVATVSVQSSYQITADQLDKTFYTRVMWRTGGGTLTNTNPYPTIPNRKFIINFFPHFDDIIYEE